MTAWLAEHVHALRSALAKLTINPLGNLFNVLAMAIALSLPAALYAALGSLSEWAAHREDHPRLSIFLAQDAGGRAFSEIAAKLKAHAEVASFETLPKQRALKALEEKLGLENVAAALGENPLPDAFIVHAKSSDFAQLSRLQEEIARWPDVSEVLWDAEWVKRLHAIVRLGESAVWVLAVLLGFGVLAITFNTVRLQVMTQRAEIEVAGLIGATRAYIRRPFLYFGALQGLIAGLACCGIVFAVVHYLQTKIEPVNTLYGARFVLGLPPPVEALAALAMAAGLAWLGALFSVGRHLARAEPSR